MKRFVLLFPLLLSAIALQACATVQAIQDIQEHNKQWEAQLPLDVKIAEFEEAEKSAKNFDRKERVRAIQTDLTSLKYKPGPVDGLFGKKTQSAIIAFQKKNGYIVTGEATHKTYVQILSITMLTKQERKRLLETIPNPEGKTLRWKGANTKMLAFLEKAPASASQAPPPRNVSAGKKSPTVKQTKEAAKKLGTPGMSSDGLVYGFMMDYLAKQNNTRSASMEYTKQMAQVDFLGMSVRHGVTIIYIRYGDLDSLKGLSWFPNRIAVTTPNGRHRGEASGMRSKYSGYDREKARGKGMVIPYYIQGVIPFDQALEISIYAHPKWDWQHTVTSFHSERLVKNAKRPKNGPAYHYYFPKANSDLAYLEDGRLIQSFLPPVAYILYYMNEFVNTGRALHADLSKVDINVVRSKLGEFISSGALDELTDGFKACEEIYKAGRYTSVRGKTFIFAGRKHVESALNVDSRCIISPTYTYFNGEIFHAGGGWFSMDELPDLQYKQSISDLFELTTGGSKKGICRHDYIDSQFSLYIGETIPVFTAKSKWKCRKKGEKEFFDETDAGLFGTHTNKYKEVEITLECRSGSMAPLFDEVRKHGIPIADGYQKSALHEATFQISREYVSTYRNEFGNMIAESIKNSSKPGTSTQSCDSLYNDCFSWCGESVSGEASGALSLSDKDKCEWSCVEARNHCEEGNRCLSYKNTCYAKCAAHRDDNGGILKNTSYDNCKDACDRKHPCR